MFALRIQFNDGITAPEMLLVRRLEAVVGAGDRAQVVLEGTGSSIPEFRLVKGLGTEFYCENLSERSVSSLEAFPRGEMSVFDKETEIDLGEVITRIWSLDVDLLSTEETNPELQSLQSLRRAVASPCPLFPSWAVFSEAVSLVSFPADLTLKAGRSRSSVLRVSATGIVGEHARFGYTRGFFWVEPLQPDNAEVRVNGQLVSSRMEVEPGQEVFLGSEVSVVGLASISDLQDLRSRLAGRADSRPKSKTFPAVIVKTPDNPQPVRLSFGSKNRLIVGRDPACDIWVQAPHVSSNHLELLKKSSATVVCLDQSTNGTFYLGSRLAKDCPITLNEVSESAPISNFPIENNILDLLMGFELAVCFSRRQEQEFYKRHKCSVQLIPENVVVRSIPAFGVERRKSSAPELRKVQSGNLVRNSAVADSFEDLQSEKPSQGEGNDPERESGETEYFAVRGMGNAMHMEESYVSLPKRDDDSGDSVRGLYGSELESRSKRSFREEQPTPTEGPRPTEKPLSYKREREKKKLNRKTVSSQTVSNPARARVPEISRVGGFKKMVFGIALFGMGCIIIFLVVALILNFNLSV